MDRDNADETEAVYIGENEDDEVIDINADDDLELNVDDELGEMELHDAESDDEPSAAETATDDAIAVFSKHTGSVFCVAVDPKTSSLAVTGGEDDVAFVWKLTDGELLFKCLGHKDSVTCVGFSHDSSLVATGDMSGLIKVWRVDSAQEIWSYEGDELEWLQWHSGSPVLLAGTMTGDLWMWQIPAGSCKTFPGHGARCTVGRFLNDGKRACVGYEDGAVKVWDLKSGGAVLSLAGGKAGHSGEVTCIDCSSNDKIIMTGSTDGTSLLINVGSGKIVTRLTCGDGKSRGSESAGAEGGGEEQGADADSIEAVGFSPNHSYMATATHFGVLTIWDSGSLVQRHQCQHDAGIIRLRWDAMAPIVYTCTEDGCLCTWDARNGDRLATWFGHRAHVLDMDIARSNAVIVTASDDHTARVFPLQRTAT